MSGRFNRDPPSSASSDRFVLKEQEKHVLKYVMEGICSRFGQQLWLYNWKRNRVFPGYCSLQV